MGNWITLIDCWLRKVCTVCTASAGIATVYFARTLSSTAIMQINMRYNSISLFLSPPLPELRKVYKTYECICKHMYIIYSYAIWDISRQLIDFVCLPLFAAICDSQLNQTVRQADRQSGSLFQFSAFSVIFMTTFCILLRHTHSHTGKYSAAGVNGKHIQVTQIQQSTHVPNNMPKHTLTLPHTHRGSASRSPQHNNNNSNNSNWLWNFLSAYTKNTIVIIIIVVLGIGKAIMHIRHINMTKAKTWVHVCVCVCGRGYGSAGNSCLDMTVLF